MNKPKDTLHDLKKIAFIGDYLPRKCGIATFTHDIRQAIARELPQAQCEVLAVSDLEKTYRYPGEVTFELREQNLRDYTDAADYVRFRNIDVISVQHEFGIYGGENGGHLLHFLRSANLPVVTTLHTILTEPNDSQRRVFEELVELSQQLVTMSERGVQILKDTYKIPDDKISLIPHGIPDMPFVDPAFYKDHFGVEGRKVLLTFGLLSPGKGLEFAIEAMPAIVRKHPDVVYIILGATHPNLVRHEGASYRHQLQKRVRELGLEEHVLFFNRFVELDELKEFIGACDVYLTPYLNPAQITSGTLAYTYGCGKAVVSTPYWHAEELLSDGKGCLVPFRDAEAISDAVIGLLDDETKRNAMRKKAYQEGRSMVWSLVAQSYADTFVKARLQAGQARPGRSLHRTAAESMDLPEVRLDHVAQMTDSTGIFQHAIYHFPRFEDGYCVDDNARALILCCLLDDLRDGSKDAEVSSLSKRYAAFIQHAYNPDTQRFRNFMSFDRKWLESTGSEDSQARVLWALGTCVGKSHNQSLQNWAAQLFDEALPALLETTSPRAWAFSLIGLHQYQRKLPGVRLAMEARNRLADKLYDLFKGNEDAAWPWCEPILSYANAKLPHALIATGNAVGDEAMLSDGLRYLRWLVEQQIDDNGLFAPVGSDGFYPRDGVRAQFDQQPIEAHATVSACLEAYQLTNEKFWLDEALRAFRWFLGSNQVGKPIYDASTGGCYDGLHIDRVNLNQGAESTLAFLLSLVELKAVEHELKTFRSVRKESQNHGNLLTT